MTYLAHRRAHIKADVATITVPTYSTVAVGTTFSISSTPTKTSATVSGGYIVLHDQSSWRIEAQFLSQYYFTTQNATNMIKIQFWDGTSYYGEQGKYSQVENLNMCRNACKLFIPSSAITTSISLIPRVVSMSGTIGDTTAATTAIALPELRIIEIPND